MPIESNAIMYVVVGLVALLLFCLAVEDIIDRAKDLLFGTKEKAIKRCLNELEVLKIEVNRLKAQLDLMATSPTIERIRPVADLPGTSQATLEDVWSRGNDAVFVQKDTWSRGARPTDMSIAPRLPETSSEETWTRSERVTENPTAKTITEISPTETWTRDASGRGLPAEFSSASRLAAAQSRRSLGQSRAFKNTA